MSKLESINNRIGKVIQNHRESKGLTQLELARMLGYPNSQFISNIERHMSKVPYVVLGQMIVILGLPEEEVLNIIKSNFGAQLIADVNLGKEKAKQLKKRKKLL